MELNGSTFILEVINFLILVWLLKRFLYQPVLNLIARRREGIEAQLAQADALKTEAEGLKRQYESRLADWEHERRDRLEALKQQLDQEGVKRRQQIEEDLERQRLKSQSREARQRQQWQRQAEAEALHLGGAFASRFLQQVSGPELDQRLRALFVEQLEALPEDEIGELRAGWQEQFAGEIVSATELDAVGQKEIREALERRLGPNGAALTFRHDPDLIAGIRVSIGGCLLQANIQDELRFFAEAGEAHD
ncbi:MAG: F0F1 ATP synthase subunit B [Gammaproteobacteria bacterium]|nr:F0F1 ATP synthase subunit B [Gammaproteobacteria bacterium]